MPPQIAKSDLQIIFNHGYTLMAAGYKLQNAARVPKPAIPLCFPILFAHQAYEQCDDYSGHHVRCELP